LYAILSNNIEKIGKTVTGLYVKRRSWKNSSIQRKEEWLLRKLEIENEVKKQLQENTLRTTATQSVKLQNYTILDSQETSKAGHVFGINFQSK
jgi:hypothetical protein